MANTVTSGTINTVDVGSSMLPYPSLVVSGTPTVGSFLQATFPDEGGILALILGTWVGELVFERLVAAGQWMSFAMKNTRTGNPVTSLVSRPGVNQDAAFEAKLVVSGTFRVRATDWVSGAADLTITVNAGGVGTGGGGVASAVQINAAPTGGWTPYGTYVATNTTNAVRVKNSAGQVNKVRITNFNTTNARTVRLFDKGSAAPVPGTDVTPKFSFTVPKALSADEPTILESMLDEAQFTLGIGFDITALSALNDATVVTAGDVMLDFTYN